MRYQTFIRTVNLIKARLNKVLTYVESLPEETPIDAVDQQKLLVYQAETKLKLAEFDKNLRKLLDVSNLPADYDEENVISRQDEVHEIAVNIESKINTCLLKLKGDDDSQSVSSDSNARQGTSSCTSVRLPKIELKHFSGDASNWLNFINLFDATIHSNPSLSPVAKFQYLLGTLSGEPLNLIKSLHISDANYTIAYDTLKERYHSVRRLTSLHMNKIIDLPNVSFMYVKNLRNFINAFNENTQSLKALDCDIVEHNPFLASVILRKLDSDILHKFESLRTDSQSIPTVAEIIKFLTDQCSHAEDASMHSPEKAIKPKEKPILSPHSPYAKPMKPKLPLSQPVTFVSTQTQNSTEFPCFVCNKTNHRIYSCSDFKGKSPQERYQIAKSHHRCFSCLGNHAISNCKSKNTCIKCNKKHHTLLHQDIQPKAPSTDQAAITQAPQSTNEHISFVGVTTNLPQPKQHSTVLLATVLVKLISPNGIAHVFRALIDSCSQCDFLTERAAQLLQIKRLKSNICVNGIAQSHTSSKGLGHLTIETLSGEKISENHPMLILDRITSELPKSPLSPYILNHVKGFTLADPTFHRPGPIDVLLGGGLFPFIFTGEKHYLGQGLPVLMNTVFGYTLMGHSPCDNNTTSREERASHYTTLLTISDFDLHASIQRFWQQEEPPTCSKLSQEEIICENHFVSTHTRDSTGRYCVRLPLKPDHPPLGDSAYSSRQRFSSLENRFKTQPDFKQTYVKFMSDYLESGHMSICRNVPPETNSHYFLPHHGVVKDSSSTTKLRVVFDASNKTSTHTSLNDILLTGAKLQVNIFDIIFHFRRHNVVFTCDIRQMYRQIRLHPNDHQFQLIFWRDEPSHPLSVYQLETVTFGLSCSPFLALRTLRQLADDEHEEFPEAAHVLRNYTYVDDVIAGHEDEEKAKELQSQLIRLLRKGGFELRKWTSNSPHLLGSLSTDHHEVPKFLKSSEQPYFSVLGIYWSPSFDSFSFNFQLDEMTSYTKRNILSIIAKISYDPCGFLSPVTMWAKIFMQLLWTKGFTWDEPLPSDIIETWHRFRSQLHVLSDLKIPRSLQLHQSSIIQLHGFSDASESGFSAVVYIRCHCDHGSVYLRNLISKTRVAPLKKVSLPRLELCGSHLLSKLLSYTLTLLSPQYNISKTYAWCDSTVVLNWIKTPPYRLKTYVGNRVSEIQELLPSSSWSHITSQHNPADCASRGILPQDLIDHPLWWTGPSWLLDNPENWPHPSLTIIHENDLDEIKPQTVTTLTTTENKPSDLLTKFSSWSKTVRVLSYILRVINHVAHKIHEVGPLTCKELNNATLKLYKIIQEESFSEEIRLLQQNKPCSTRIQRLSPFLDNDGLIRVGGRLKQSTLAYNAKHPVILPKSHHLINLLVDHYHIKHLHAPPQLLQSLLTQEVWIISARSIIRSRIFSCMKCFRSKPRNATPLMGDLPKSRITPARAFLTTGMDFCGPFPAKAHTLRSLRQFKLYVCIFICFTTKAVHLETVSDLSSSTFIAALSRFVSRRGVCQTIYCDNGTNFHGANNILKDASVTSFFKSDDNRKKLSDFSTQHSIEFKFNPPAAPHQGGLWEAAVKSMKYHLRRVIGENVLTIEEYNTITTKIEAIMNSRPLVPLSSDPSDIATLTPGHFLIGAPLTALPETNVEDVPLARLKRWHRIQSFSQQIWRRWSRDYLHTLQRRVKWSKQTSNLKVGDLVLVEDSQTSPLSWPLARIVATHPGTDNIVRVVTLKTKNGIFTRPAVKVFPLPLN